MKLELGAEKLYAVTVNLIDTGDGVVLKRGRTQIKVAGEDAGVVVSRVLSAAQAGVSKEQILEQFSAPERPAVEALVDHLIGRRILVPAGTPEPIEAAGESSLDIFYWHFETQVAEVRQRLDGARIHIFGVNYISRQLAAGLRASGASSFQLVDVPLLRNESLFDWPDSTAIRPLGKNPDPESIGCLVATSDTGAIEQLRAWNEFCVLHRIQFLPVMLQDLVGYVGPLVAPGETACFECLRSRQNAHLMDYQSRRTVEAAFLHEQAAGGFHPSMASILGDIAAMELTKSFGLGARLARPGTMIEVNLLGCEMKSRRVLKLPRCPVCSRLNRTPSTAFTRATLLGPDAGESH